MTQLERVLQTENFKPDAPGGLTAHVDELIEAHHTEVLRSTTSTTAAVGELALRNEGLEQAIRALALAIDNLASAV